jgi:ParB-like chromosome segregation protein Spo0J
VTTQPWITPEIPIGSIIVGKRHRTDPGDIKGLADSIDTIGLIHPIVVTPDHRLIAGQRRLLALKKLGWDMVPVNIIHTLNGAVDELLAERDENLCRKAMTVSEMAVLGAELERLEADDAKRRQLEGSLRGGEATRAKFNGEGGALPPNDSKAPRDQRTTDHKVGQALGVSSTTYHRIKDVYKTATGQTDALPEEVEVAKQALAQADKGALSINAAHEAVREGVLDRQKGRGHEKRQLRALEGVKPQLSGVATALEVAFDGGFEKTCTRAIALEYVKMFKTELTRINRIVSRLEKYGKEV